MKKFLSTLGVFMLGSLISLGITELLLRKTRKVGIFRPRGGAFLLRLRRIISRLSALLGQLLQDAGDHLGGGQTLRVHDTRIGRWAQRRRLPSLVQSVPLAQVCQNGFVR